MIELKDIDEMLDILFQQGVEKGIYKSVPEQVVCCDKIRHSSRTIVFRFMESLLKDSLTITLFDHVVLVFQCMCLGIVFNYLFSKNNNKISVDGEDAFKLIKEEINLKQVPLFAAGAMGCSYESREFRDCIKLIGSLSRGDLYYGYFLELDSNSFNNEQAFNNHALTIYKACFLFGFDYMSRYCEDNRVNPVFDFDEDYPFCESLYDESGMLNIAVVLLKKGRYDRLSYFLNNNGFEEIYPDIQFDVYLNAVNLDLIDYVKEKSDEFATKDNMLSIARYAKGKTREYLFTKYYPNPYSN